MGDSNGMAGMGNDLVREARRRARLTEAELAARAGTPESAIEEIEAGDSAPSFDTVLRLIRLCGLDLHVSLVPRDDTDWIQAQQLLRLTPEERLMSHQRFVQRLDELRQAEAELRANRAQA